LLYSTNSGSTYPNTIATGESNDGTYSWTVPNDASSTVKVKVQDTFYQEITETTNASFSSGTTSNTQVDTTAQAVKLSEDTSDIVGWWHFNTDSNSDTTTSDSSGSNYTGTITGAAWSESGGLNQMLLMVFIQFFPKARQLLLTEGMYLDLDRVATCSLR
jgi:hypothetical protein